MSAQKKSGGANTGSEGGKNRSKGVSWTELIENDARPAPDFLREESYTFRGSEPLPVERYTDAKFAEREDEKMWPNVWQFAAREEELPEPGNFVVYENAGRSFLLSRQDDGLSLIHISEPTRPY